VAIAGGRIVEVGQAPAVIARHPGASIETYDKHLIMAGFVDCHVHYPQIDIIASYGEQLLEWLEKYTFPAEARFCDRAHADSAANRFLDECLRHGITTASVYCTTHPASVDARSSRPRGRDSSHGGRQGAGWTRNAPDDLKDTAERGYAESGADRPLARVDRLTYVVTPRFAVTSSAAQLEAAGALWSTRRPRCRRICPRARRDRAVKTLHPGPPDYLRHLREVWAGGTRRQLRPRHPPDAAEFARLWRDVRELSHRPTSNLFIGSGLFDMRGLRERDHRSRWDCLRRRRRLVVPRCSTP
jgi:guanine deaminase